MGILEFTLVNTLTQLGGAYPCKTTAATFPSSSAPSNESSESGHEVQICEMVLYFTSVYSSSSLKLGDDSQGIL